MDVPLFSILLGNPTAAARDQVADVKVSVTCLDVGSCASQATWPSHSCAHQGRLSTEWLALWDGASHVTHSQKAHHGPWQATLNGPNDFLIYSKGKLTNADVADRLLKVPVFIAVIRPSAQ